MPNWCDNTIVINANNKSTIENIRKLLESEESLFTFENVIPSPKKKEDCDPKYYITEDSHVMPEEERPWFNWYDWHCDNWGPKWDATDAEVLDASDYCVEYNFLTPWTSCELVIGRLSEMFPDATIHYECGDSGCDWSFSSVFSEGTLIEYEEGNYNKFFYPDEADEEEVA